MIGARWVVVLLLVLAACQLLLERRQSLVGREGALGLLGRLGRGGTARGRCAGTGARGGRSVGLGGGSRLDLLGVGLPGGAGVGVLPLPLLPLLVEALEPLARLGVEAVGVDVVALGVVRGGH